MFSQIKNKLNKKTGESIAETLISILIVAICFVMLQHAITVSSRINESSTDQINPFNETSKTVQSCQIYVDGSGSQTQVNNMICYKTQGGYYYYE